MAEKCIDLGKFSELMNSTINAKTFSDGVATMTEAFLYISQYPKFLEEASDFTYSLRRFARKTEPAVNYLVDAEKIDFDTGMTLVQLASNILELTSSVSGFDCEEDLYPEEIVEHLLHEEDNHTTIIDDENPDVPLFDGSELSDSDGEHDVETFSVQHQRFGRSAFSDSDEEPNIETPLTQHQRFGRSQFSDSDEESNVEIPLVHHQRFGRSEFSDADDEPSIEIPVVQHHTGRSTFSDSE